MRIIKFIDKDHNGFITTTEIDDILNENIFLNLEVERKGK